jgi:hypothetical protein
MKRLMAIAGLLLLVCGGCNNFAQSASSGRPGYPAMSSTVGGRQSLPDKEVYDENAPIKPDPKLTPGAVLEVTKEDICTPGYSKKVRDVPSSVKKKVYEEYGITSHQPGEYEVDHLISLELGGSNSIKNLWPESYKTKPWNAHVKDKVENKLHIMICSDKIDLKTAQQEIATDWIAAYQKYVSPTPEEGSKKPRHRKKKEPAPLSP